MNEVQIFSNGNIDLPVKEVDGQIYFAAEQSAIGLGISHIANSGNEVVRWDRVNKYLGVPTSGHDKISKGSWITKWWRKSSVFQCRDESPPFLWLGK